MRHASPKKEFSSSPLGYFITMRTYGTWLHGDERGSVDMKNNAYQTPRVAANSMRRDCMANRMRYAPFLIGASSASLVEETIRAVCVHRHWNLYAVHARTNHVHVVVTAGLAPERIMNDLKSWGTRRLREHGFADAEQRVWAEHGSTHYLWTETQLFGAVSYARDWQGGPLQRAWEDVRQAIDERNTDRRQPAE